MAGKELRHIGSHSRQPGKGVDSRGGKDESQNALMLVESCGLESALALGTDDEGGDLPPDMIEVAGISFIECDDQEATTLKCGIGDQRRDVGLQPGIRLRKAPIMRIIHEVGGDERILR